MRSWGVVKLPFLRIEVWPATLLVCAFCRLAFAGTETKVDPAPLNFIVSSMEQAQSDVQLPRQITREYHVGTPASISSDSEVVAEMDFAPPGRYVIQKRYGSYRTEFVVKNLLQHELQISSSNEKLRAAAITHQNYDFRYVGKDILEGHSCYLLQLLPKREQPELIRGRVWVDQQTFLMRRIDGDLAKSPSWWVKAAHVDIRFAEFRGMWLQTSWIALADIRCFGAQKLSSQVLDYAAEPVTVRNVRRRSTPAFAATATH